MQDTAIKTDKPAPAPVTAMPVADSPAPTIKNVKRGLPYRILVFCASLRITVVLFVLAFLLVFFGTWAQVDAGIWTVVTKYFRGWGFTAIPLKIIFLRAFDIPDSVTIPYPRGYTIGCLLLINLLAAHAIRFKLTWRRSGILILHFGIILMMVGEFITGEFAIEGRMVIVESYASDHVDSDRKTELAIVDRSDPARDNEITVPDSLLAHESALQNPDLPFDIEVLQFMANSDLREPTASEKNLATAGNGLGKIGVRVKEVSGTDQQSMEITSAYVKLKKKGTGEDLGTLLVSTWFDFLRLPADTITVDGKQYQVYLRPKRSYRDYTIQLRKFDNEVYPGTDIPRNYSSEINLRDPGQQENRNVKIWMNHPLRYQGETFYQSGVLSLAKGTILQVVRNPGWELPYVSCALVALGMLIHFGINLVGFLERKLT
jgi:hypothetical protein